MKFMNNMPDNQKHTEDEELRQAELLNEYIDDLRAEKSSAVFSKLTENDTELLHLMKTARDMKNETTPGVPSEEFAARVKQKILLESEEDVSFRYSESSPSSYGWWGLMMKRAMVGASVMAVILLAVFVVQGVNKRDQENQVVVKNTPAKNTNIARPVANKNTDTENTNAETTNENTNTKKEDEEATTEKDEIAEKDNEKTPETSNTNAVGGGEAEEFAITSTSVVALAQKYDQMAGDLDASVQSANTSTEAYNEVNDDAAYNQMQSDISALAF